MTLPPLVRQLIENKLSHYCENKIPEEYRDEIAKKPEDWNSSSARARRYQKGLIPDEVDIPVLMK